MQGQTKLEGEIAIQKLASRYCILRVPILYGPREYNGESAVTILIDTALSAKPAAVDDIAQRFPTNVIDVARIVKELIVKQAMGININGVFHFSAKELFTKYTMCQAIGRVYEADIGHLTTSSKVDATRPLDSHLSTERLETELGVDCAFIRFEDWLRENK
jgi:S-adenosylmethionine synthetase